jgi:hypothetical protein
LGYTYEYGGHSQIKLSRKGQSKLKLSGSGNECKPLADGKDEVMMPSDFMAAGGRGLHSSTSQLNLSRV